MSNTAEIRRVLRVTFEGDSMRGSLDDSGGRFQPFSGWLELLAAIEDLRPCAGATARQPSDHRAGGNEIAAVASRSHPPASLESQQSKGAKMTITEVRVTAAMPVYEPPYRVRRPPEHSDLVRRDRRALEHPTTDTGQPDATARERWRAHMALVALWAGLAAAIVAYAIARESIGALILALFVAWLARVPWTIARSRRREAAPDTRPISFIP
jgi:hypothetical protein